MNKYIIVTNHLQYDTIFYEKGDKMKKKLSILISVLVILIIGFIWVDEQLDLGIVHRVEVALDNEAPSIETNSLREKYLLNEDYILDVSCTDNVDYSCQVTIVGVFDLTEEGAFEVKLVATDKKGNVSEYIYQYQVVTNAASLNIPNGYYDGIDGLLGEALKAMLNSIINDHQEYPYTHNTQTDLWDILRHADEDPNNPDHIIGIYTGLSIAKDCQDTINPPAFCEIEAYGEMKLVEWNREHVWSKSRGDFSDENHTAHNDAHHLVAAERVMNSIKNNRFFEDCHDGDDDNIVDRGYGNFTCNLWSFEPRDEVKGDIARMIFYMVVRYEDASFDLEVINDPEQYRDTNLPYYGDIDDLLRWHILDPVSEDEVRRNDIIFSYQGNRNPFIDLPELVALIWGSPEDYSE